MNPANSVNSSGAFNGGGNAFPMVGTGHILYGQFGYLFRTNLLGEGTIQLFAASQYSSFDRLVDNMLMWEAGLNWLIDGHTSKLTIEYQSRPVFRVQPGGAIILSDRKGMFVVQYQVSI